MIPANESLGTILLAAGGSSRLGRPKQLIEIDNEPLVRRQARLLLALQPACVVVVTGAEADAVGAALSDLPVTLVHNPVWADGMGRSLACGIRAMPERVRATLVLLCDQWRIVLPDLEALVAVWGQNPTLAVTAQWEDGTGPPAILPRALFQRLAGLRGNVGARQVLKRLPEDVRRLSLPHAAFDLDSAADVRDWAR